MAAALQSPLALECTEQLNFEQLDPEPPPSDSAPDVAPDPLPPHEVSPPPAEPLPPPPQTPQADDAAALLLMLSSPGADSPVAPFSLPPSQSSKQANSPRGFKEGGQKSSSPSKRAVVKVDRVLRCGTCEGCRRGDCARCPNCRDKPKFGGAGVKKQACQYRSCLQPTRTGGGQWSMRQGQPGEGDSNSDGDVSEGQSTVPYISPLHQGRAPAVSAANAGAAALAAALTTVCSADDPSSPMLSSTPTEVEGEAEADLKRKGANLRFDLNEPRESLHGQTAELDVLADNRDPSSPKDGSTPSAHSPKRSRSGRPTTFTVVPKGS